MVAREGEGRKFRYSFMSSFFLSSNKSFFDCLIFTRSNLFDEKVQTCQKDVWRFRALTAKTRNRKNGILWEEMWRQDYAYRWSHIKILNLANGSATTCAALSAVRADWKRIRVFATNYVHDIYSRDTYLLTASLVCCAKKKLFASISANRDRNLNSPRDNQMMINNNNNSFAHIFRATPNSLYVFSCVKYFIAFAYENRF